MNKYKHIFVSCTQEQYDSLKNKDEDTIYFTGGKEEKENEDSESNEG